MNSHASQRPSNVDCFSEGIKWRPIIGEEIMNAENTVLHASVKASIIGVGYNRQKTVLITFNYVYVASISSRMTCGGITASIRIPWSIRCNSSKSSISLQKPQIRQQRCQVRYSRCYITTLGQERRYPCEGCFKILCGLDSNPNLFTSVNVSMSTAGGLPSLCGFYGARGVKDLHECFKCLNYTGVDCVVPRSGNVRSTLLVRLHALQSRERRPFAWPPANRAIDRLWACRHYDVQFPALFNAKCDLDYECEEPVIGYLHNSKFPTRHCG
ncbi:hypothetical protein BDR04DRAFT_173338 [Suillus decipiens]|nr:hypothetical protein BDR04DRAFT_173338 [Suillus decipiens]